MVTLEGRREPGEGGLVRLGMALNNQSIMYGGLAEWCRCCWGMELGRRGAERCTGRSAWARGRPDGGEVSISNLQLRLSTRLRTRRRVIGVAETWGVEVVELLWATDVRTTARCWMCGRAKRTLKRWRRFALASHFKVQEG